MQNAAPSRLRQKPWRWRIAQRFPAGQVAQSLTFNPRSVELSPAISFPQKGGDHGRTINTAVVKSACL